MSDNGFSQKLAKLIARTDYADLPNEVVHQAKRVILDLIGCALGGSLTDLGNISVSVLRELGGVPESTVVGCGLKTSCLNAAYANARMGNILDAEETYYINAHFASPSVFTALALAERKLASGKDFIVASLVGFDLGARVGMAIGNPYMSTDRKTSNHERYASGDARVFAAVGSACRSLGLNEEQICHALGIAGANSPLKSRYVLAMQRGKAPHFKYGDYGWNSANGIMAALNAQMGLTAFPFILDEDSSFWERYHIEKDFGLLAGRLGEKWYIMDTTFKPWPSCRVTHPALTAFNRIAEEHDLVPNEIERVTIYASSGAAPTFANQNTTEMTQSQFNFPYPIAMIAYRIPPGPNWYTPQMLADPEIQAFRKKVFVEPHPAASRLHEFVVEGQWRQMPAKIVVEARGHSFVSETDWAKGDPWSPDTYMTDDVLREKFRNMASPVAPASKRWQEQLEKIADIVFQLEEVEDIRELTSLLSPYGS